MSHLDRRSPNAPARHGFTLAELMISIVLFGMIMALVMQVLARQQRFHRGASAVVEMRGQMRHATYALPVELRSISPAGGDIIDWTHSSITFRSFSATTAICDRLTASKIVLPPTVLTQGNTLSAWNTAPVVGDSILMHDENLLIGNNDDTWRAHRITDVTTLAGGCPATTGFTVAGDALTHAYVLTLSPNLSATVVDGAPLRVYRQVTYELFEAADGKFYLGVSDCLPGRVPECSDVSPVGGPFRAVDDDPGLSGFALTYFAEDGTELDPAADDPADVARIELVVRAQTDTPFSTTQATGHYGDSLSFVIGLRNR